LLLACEHVPADPHHLVGERDDGDVSMAARFHMPEPFAEIRAIALHVQAQRMDALDEELPQVRIRSQR
jgi:hypothetical protein